MDAGGSFVGPLDGLRHPWRPGRDRLALSYREQNIPLDPQKVPVDRFLTDARSIAVAFRSHLVDRAPAVAASPFTASRRDANARVASDLQDRVESDPARDLRDPGKPLVQLHVHGLQGRIHENFGYDQTTTRLCCTRRRSTRAGNRPLDQRVLCRLRRVGQPARDGCKMDGWNSAYACCHQPANFGYAYAPRSEVKPYWRWPSNTCWPTTCSNRISTAVSCPTSTRSPHTRASR